MQKALSKTDIKNDFENIYKAVIMSAELKYSENFDVSYFNSPLITQLAYVFNELADKNDNIGLDFPFYVKESRSKKSLLVPFTNRLSLLNLDYIPILQECIKSGIYLSLVSNQKNRIKSEIQKHSDLESNVGRNHYRNVCRFLRKMIKMGARVKASQVIEQLRSFYPQRKALLEELQKVKI